MRTVVAVLRGGPSSEYDVSLKSGATVLEELDRDRYEPRDIFISKSGEWHSRGIPVPPHQALRGVEVAFNVLHGSYGEDGTVHKILEMHAIPYTGSKIFPSVLAFNKQRTKEAIAPLGVTVAHGIVVPRMAAGELEARALEIFRSFPMPAIVKPVTGGSSVGTTLAKDFQTLHYALGQAFSVSPKALVEEFIKGREATVGVIEHFRGERLYALPPVEIIPPSSADFFDYQVKYNGSTVEVCPGNFSEAEKKELMDVAKRVHQALDLSHYSRSDFIVAPRGIYFLEVNNAAAIGMTGESLFPKALRAVGSKLSEFLTHVIELARGGSGSRM